MSRFMYYCASTGRHVIARIILADVSGIGDDDSDLQEVGRECLECRQCELWPACPLEEA